MGFTFGKIKAVLMGVFSGTDTKVAVDTDGHLQVDVVLLGHGSSHENGNADEIDCAGLDGRANYVDRPTTTYDFEAADLTKDSSWYDLDLSSIVPAGTKQVVLAVIMANTSATKYIQFRTKGVTTPAAALTLYSQVANQYIKEAIPVTPDGDRKIQYYVQTATWTFIGITVVSYLV